MDAKAKVVAVVTGQYRQLGTVPQLIVACVDRLADGTELIPLTDHEAALAAIREELEFAQIRGDDWRAKFDADTDVIRDLKQQITTLLTGLEALAGEWDAQGRRNQQGDVGEQWCGAARLNDAHELRDRIRTLTNSAKGGA